jgi:hypothetical protein
MAQVARPNAVSVMTNPLVMKKLGVTSLLAAPVQETAIKLRNG